MQQEFITPLEIGLKRGEEIGIRKGEKMGIRKGEMRGIILAMHEQNASREETGKLLMKLYHMTLEEANRVIDTMSNLG